MGTVEKGLLVGGGLLVVFLLLSRRTTQPNALAPTRQSDTSAIAGVLTSLNQAAAPILAHYFAPSGSANNPPTTASTVDTAGATADVTNAADAAAAGIGSFGY